MRKSTGKTETEKRRDSGADREGTLLWTEQGAGGRDAYGKV